MRIALTSILMIAMPALAGAEILPPGGKVDKAVTANITNDGLDFLLDQGLAVIPDQIAIPQTSGTVNNPCVFDDVDYTIYQGQPANGVNVNITNAVVTPQDGYLQLAISGVASGTGTDDPPGGTGPQTYTVTRVEYSGCGTSCN